MDDRGPEQRDGASRVGTDLASASRGPEYSLDQRVVEAISASGRSEDAVTAYALTNPIFVDVDGTGRFDPPLPAVIRPDERPP